MKRLFSAADEYLKDCTWRDMALLKFCLCAIGVLIGVAIPARRKKCAVWCAAAVFLATYIPLMKKFLAVLKSRRSKL